MRGALEPARIDWSRPGAPVSARHGDVYFNAADGLSETRHVFLAGNRLPEAWQGRRVFTIGETGFGTGLNFLAAWNLWRRAAPAEARLHFVSVEGWPLTPDDLERAHRPFTELAPLARRLRALYPHLYAGFHRLHFDDERVTLTLLFGEAGDMLAGLDARMDAWFLDGFSPARNPDLWRAEILARIGALTRPGGTAASFTVAGAVRRELEKAGFEVEKAPGFGRKRHMLHARKAGKAPVRPDAESPATALVIGAGLAGSSAAWALARRGVAVTLIDPDPELRQAASGNPAGLAAPRPTADASPAGRFHCAAFDYAQRHVFRAGRDVFAPCGVLELAAGEQARRRHEAFASGHVLPESAMRALSAEAASQIAGIPLPVPAVHFPEGGLARPAACAAWMRGRAELRRARVTGLERMDRGWEAALAGGGHAAADIAVLACGMGAADFPEAGAAPLTASRGQLSLAPASPESARLKTALSFGAYLSPPVA
ncbi:MAG: tRNA (5-methylaminomethyl-2-thiouridine)(34)-methyltransferase MnmD, partial [Alphaproteobacteria bacterium]